MAHLTMGDLGTTVESTQERLARLCAGGDEYACRLAASSRTSAPVVADTPETALARAQERDRQAEADRAAIARRLESAGVSSRIADAVRRRRDVGYARDQADAARLEREMIDARRRPNPLSTLLPLAVLGAVFFAMRKK